MLISEKTTCLIWFLIAWFLFIYFFSYFKNIFSFFFFASKEAYRWRWGLQKIPVQNLTDCCEMCEKLLWVPWTPGHLSVNYKFVYVCGGGSYKLSEVYEFILKWRVPKIRTWDSLLPADKRQRIVWKFRGMQNYLCWH